MRGSTETGRVAPRAATEWGPPSPARRSKSGESGDRAHPPHAVAL